MGVIWKNDKLVFVGGKVGTSELCCEQAICNTACCSGFPDVNLKLSITEFTVNAGGICPGGCLSDAIEVINWPANGTDPRDGAVWSFNCPPDNPGLRGSLAIFCTGTTYQIVNSFFALIQIIDRCEPLPITVQCFIAPSNFYLGRTDLEGEVTCNPFFIDKVVPTTMRAPGLFDVCATGSMRITITE